MKNKKLSKDENLVFLWEKVLKGDKSAFGCIHKALYPGLFGYAMKMVREEELVDDLLQDLFVKFWENCNSIGALNNVKSYFFKSVRSIVLNHIKSSSSKLNKLSGVPEPELDFSREEIIVADEMDSELKFRMLLAVNNLPKKQREAVYLKFYEGLEYAQIAQVTGIRYQSVINHVYRAMQSLKDVVELKRIYAA